MQNLMIEIAMQLNRSCALRPPPAPFPELRLHRRLTADAWYMPYLKQPMPANFQMPHEVFGPPEDVTGQCTWNAASNTLTLAARLFKKAGYCRIYGLALLSEAQLADLCTAQPRVLPGQPFTLQVSRTTVFCIWDQVFAELLLAHTPLCLPPFLESRKMIQMDIHFSGSKPTTSPCVIHLQDVHPLLSPSVFYPGYLIPHIALREKQVPRVIFRDQQCFQHIFYDLNPDNLLFVHATLENGAPPLTLYSHDLVDGQFQHTCRIQSYTVVSSPPTRAPDEDQSGTTALAAEQARLRPLIQDVTPRDTFFNHFLTAIPSRGDLQQLLHQLPLARKLKLSLSTIDGQTIDHSSPAFQPLLATRPLTDYAWFLHTPPVPLSLPNSPARLDLIVLTFNCEQPASDIFQNNLLDYVCSCLSQYFQGACRVISAQRQKELLL